MQPRFGLDMSRAFTSVENKSVRYGTADNLPKHATDRSGEGERDAGVRRVPVVICAE